ncbi:cell wall glucanosyltransferase Mwg1 [Purpureocillium lavendulum]|uniref:Crh-like protein n=1 Tax=Purpureocillium lavendulum TaxID=1247861 RepID=A0AB34FFK2_9HYPO|nr:cell wall glucanosyltransferase Mwg1 [Purpureocillium lavendulum]
MTPGTSANMLSKAFSAAAVALAASTLVSAQTSTLCNPLKKTCPADPAFGGTTTCDFTKGACSAFDSADGTSLKYNGNGAVFSISKDSDAPTIHSPKYIFFGKVDVVVQAAPGVGIVTSAVLQSDDLDEIDWEWLGGDNAQVQTNYFSKGDTSTYDRGAYHPVANPTGQFHTYTVEWTSQAVTWSIDGAVVRTLTAAAAKGGAAFPQTPMQIKLGSWVAGRKDAPEGTVQWAGGYADYKKAPFLAYYKSISITDYAGKDKPANGGIKEYIYTDNSGTWQSIKVVGGNSDDSSTTTSKADSTSTKATKTSTKTTEASSTEATTSSAASKTTSAESKTTLTTASSSASKTESGSGNATASTPAGSNTSPAATGSTTPTTVPGSGATRGVAAVGSVLLAGAGVMVAQLLL